MPSPDDDVIRVLPSAQEKLDKLMADDPEFAKAYREFAANLRQAMQAVQEGRYERFEDAMEAITGQRPKRVDLDDDALPALEDDSIALTDFTKDPDIE
jgi:hypothetical protein